MANSLHDTAQVTEPDNLTGAEFCAVANASEIKSGLWGWADTACSDRHAFLCEVPPCSSYSYCATATGYNYSLVTCPASYSQAEGSCRMLGGHLASYGSLAEQAEVEGYFMAQGLLAPSQQAYWLGAKVGHVALASQAFCPGPGCNMIINMLAASTTVCLC